MDGRLITGTVQQWTRGGGPLQQHRAWNGTGSYSAVLIESDRERERERLALSRRVVSPSDPDDRGWRPLAQAHVTASSVICSSGGTTTTTSAGWCPPLCPPLRPPIISRRLTEMDRFGWARSRLPQRPATPAGWRLERVAHSWLPSQSIDPGPADGGISLAQHVPWLPCRPGSYF